MVVIATTKEQCYFVQSADMVLRKLKIFKKKNDIAVLSMLNRCQKKKLNCVKFGSKVAKNTDIMLLSKYS